MEILGDNSGFLNKFDESMTKLFEIKKNIQTSVQFKEEFTKDLKVRLGEINQTIIKLSGLITELKTKASNLEGQVNTNKTSIGDKEGELKKLNDQVVALTAERDNLTDQITTEQEVSKKEMARLKGVIDESEAKLRDLTQQKEVASNELQALRAELEGKGDQSAHAEAIKQLTEQSQKSLQEQEAVLLKKIAECDAKVAELEQKIQTQEIESAEQLIKNDEDTAKAKTSAQDLQQQIDALKAENKQLIDRIIAATRAINQANDELQNMVNIVPDAATKKDVDDLLNQITQQLESSIENISRAAQGQTTTLQLPTLQDLTLPPPPTNINSTLLPPLPPSIAEEEDAKPKIDPDTEIIFKNGTSLKFGDILEMLKTKVNDTRYLRNKVDGRDASIKYRQALKALRELSDASQVPDAIQKSGVTIKNNAVMGGRKTRKITKAKKATKTRKIRKQKGGFIYKPNTKRKKIRTSQLRNVSRRTFR